MAGYKRQVVSLPYILSPLGPEAPLRMPGPPPHKDRCRVLRQIGLAYHCPTNILAVRSPPTCQVGIGLHDGRLAHAPRLHHSSAQHDRRQMNRDEPVHTLFLSQECFHRSLETPHSYRRAIAEERSPPLMIRRHPTVFYVATRTKICVVICQVVKGAAGIRWRVPPAFVRVAAASEVFGACRWSLAFAEPSASWRLPLPPTRPPCQKQEPSSVNYGPGLRGCAGSGARR